MMITETTISTLIIVDVDVKEETLNVRFMNTNIIPNPLSHGKMWDMH
jgi:hypothetical protein